MASFSIDFPDVTILATLGDDLTIEPVGGTPTIIKGVFEERYIDDAFAEIGVIYPTVEIDIEDKQYFKNGFVLKFNGKSYKVLRMIPSQVEKTLVVLRSFFEV
jgi:hypothetical protein